MFELVMHDRLFSIFIKVRVIFHSSNTLILNYYQVFELRNIIGSNLYTCFVSPIN